MEPASPKAIFLDRDGVLNELVYYPDWGEYESPRVAADLRLLPGVIPALTALLGQGWLLFVVSNQPSYAKGKTTLADLEAVHAAIESMMREGGIVFSAFYYDYSHPQSIVPEYAGVSEFRKPNPGSLLRAHREFAIDLGRSWMAGDRDTDVECGQRAGCRTALIRYRHSLDKQGRSQPDLTCDDLPDFVRRLSGA